MRLNHNEDAILERFISERFAARVRTNQVPDNVRSILKKAEIGARFTTSEFRIEGEVMYVNLASVTGQRLEGPPQFGANVASIVFREDENSSLRMIDALCAIQGMSIYVLISSSWRCFVNCGDRLIIEVCPTRKLESCCEQLRNRC